MDRDDQPQAVFWCSLLSPLLLGEIPEAERESFFRQLAERDHLLPNGQRRRLSARTMRRWWKRLKEEGIEGGCRRSRSDRGKPRATQQSLLDRAVELKTEQPRRSHTVINRILVHEFGRGIPRSTLYRHLKLAGATRRKLGGGQPKVRCRWTRDHAGALWVGDFEHGPPVLYQGRAIPTRLSAWIDCHSRFVVEARYYLHENFDILTDSLIRAWSCHGVSRELYVDNAKIYHANALKLACSELNVKLLHRPPRDPAPGGLIERLFQTLQGQLEAEIYAANLMSIGDINRALNAWLTLEYHAAIHSETGESPHDRFQNSTRFQRTVRLDGVLPLFWRREQRTVHRDFSDITLDNRYFAVDTKLRGDRVEVRFDPFQIAEQLNEVDVFSLDGAFLGIGRLYQRERGFHEQPTPPAPRGPIEASYIEALQAGHESSHEQRRQQGLDFHSASQRNVWPLTSFATLLAKLLGREGGLSSLSPEELNALEAFHRRHNRVQETLVRQAVARSETTSIAHVLLELQSLLSDGGS